MENKKQYCILCGAENRLTDKFCHKCGESLDQKDDELQTYITERAKEKTKESVREKAENTFISWLEKLLRSKAYGFLLTFSIIASTTMVLAGQNNTGIEKFSADTPGTFIDGVQYGQPYSYQQEQPTLNEKELFSYPVKCTAYYGDDGDLEQLLLRPEGAIDKIIHLVVTTGNQVLFTDKIDSIEYANSIGSIDITGVDCIIEIVEEFLTEEKQNTWIYTVDPTGYITSKKEIKNGIALNYEKYNSENSVIYREMYDYTGALTGTLECEYYDSGCLKQSRQYTMINGNLQLSLADDYYENGLSQNSISYAESGNVFSETVWDEDGNGHYIYYKTDTELIQSETYYIRDTSGSHQVVKSVVYHTYDNLIKIERLYDFDRKEAVEIEYSYRGAAEGSLYGYKISETYMKIDDSDTLVETKKIYYDEQGQIAAEYYYD